jgi:hypothetical protein
MFLDPITEDNQEEQISRIYDLFVEEKLIRAINKELYIKEMFG